MKSNHANLIARLRTRLLLGPPLLLDGATGTELERRGVRTGLPLWSTHALLEAPALVEEIHRDYVEAGAEILTANTFRTQQRTLARGGYAERAAQLTVLAVQLARNASQRAARFDAPDANVPPTLLGRFRVPLIAGSAPPLEDCYHPERVPDPQTLYREHTEHIQNLVAAGVDLVLIETMNTIREAKAALQAAHELHATCCVSFVCREDGRLLSGETLSDAIEAVVLLEPLAVLVNCLPASYVPSCLAALQGGGLPFGVYANLGAPDAVTGFHRSEECSPEAFATLSFAWVEAGAHIIGGCCGTTPAHIRAIAQAQSARSRASEARNQERGT